MLICTACVSLCVLWVCAVQAKRHIEKQTTINISCVTSRKYSHVLLSPRLWGVLLKLSPQVEVTLPLSDSLFLFLSLWRTEQKMEHLTNPHCTSWRFAYKIVFYSTIKHVIKLHIFNKVNINTVHTCSVWIPLLLNFFFSIMGVCNQTQGVKISLHTKLAYMSWA